MATLRVTRRIVGASSLRQFSLCWTLRHGPAAAPARKTAAHLQIARHCASGGVGINDSVPGVTQPCSLGALLAKDGGQRFLFVGGKGGVGKTTTAAALALRLAATGRRTLVVSTDPAHSLGDALGMNLTGIPEPVCMDRLETVSAGSLHAMEIDPAKVVEDFRRALRLDQLLLALRDGRGGLGVGFLKALAQAGVDLEALAALLELSPPGIDEAVALGRLMQLLGDNEHGSFDRIVIDTAPTGHTLRLLAFPRFLHGLIGNLLSITEKVQSLSSPFSGFLGRMVNDELPEQLRISKAHLEKSMGSMASMNEVFADADKTSFIVVAIPTHLAVEESLRLLASLDQAQMPARHVVMNQCPFLHAGESNHYFGLAQAASEKLSGSAADSAGISPEETQAIRHVLQRLDRQRQDAKKQVDLLEHKVGDSVRIVCAPVFDEELTGPVALDKYARRICEI